jgi:ribosomal protein S3
MKALGLVSIIKSISCLGITTKLEQSNIIIGQTTAQAKDIDKEMKRIAELSRNNKIKFKEVEKV